MRAPRALLLLVHAAQDRRRPFGLKERPLRQERLRVDATASGALPSVISRVKDLMLALGALGCTLTIAIALGSVALGYAAGTRHEHSRRSRYMPL